MRGGDTKVLHTQCLLIQTMPAQELPVKSTGLSVLVRNIWVSVGSIIRRRKHKWQSCKLLRESVGLAFQTDQETSQKRKSWAKAHDEPGGADFAGCSSKQCQICAQEKRIPCFASRLPAPSRHHHGYRVIRAAESRNLGWLNGNLILPFKSAKHYKI